MRYFAFVAVAGTAWLSLCFPAQASISCPPPNESEPAFVVCHSFDGSDGEFPEAGPSADSKGNLYITTFGSLGGGEPGKHCSKSCGSADSISVSDSALKVLHRFQPGDTAGSFPVSELVVQKGRVIFGTAEYGPGTGCGGLGCGTVFQIQNHKATKVVTFCNELDCADGAFPRPGLVADGQNTGATLYGMTMLGGEGEGSLCGSQIGGCGVIYDLAYDGTEYVKNVLYSFCTPDKVQQNLCTDGAVPLGRLWRDPSTKILYGTTQFGGANGQGAVFQLTPDGQESVLYSFCSRDQSCSDGAVPEAGVTADTSGHLYGTTASGGAACDQGTSGCGVVFKLVQNGDGSWSETVLHTFTGAEGQDGELPQGAISVDRAGNLYGTTLRGGNGVCKLEGVDVGCGTVFAISSSGDYRVLHSFSAPKNNQDGEHPEGTLLLQDDDQYLYGSARVGGNPICTTGPGCGTLFRIDLTIAKARIRAALLSGRHITPHRRL